MLLKDWLAITGESLFCGILVFFLERYMFIPPLETRFLLKIACMTMIPSFLMLYFTTLQINKAKLNEVSRKLDR